MSRSRISEGFHRVGLVVAIPCVLVGLGFLISAGFHQNKIEQWERPALKGGAERPATFRISTPSGVHIDFPAGTDNATVARVMAQAVGNVRVGAFDDLIPQIDWDRPDALVQRDILAFSEAQWPYLLERWTRHKVYTREHRDRDLSSSLVSFLVGLGWYASMWAIGWIANGFVSAAR